MRITNECNADSLNRLYYWGDCDKTQFYFGDDANAEFIRKLWKVKNKNDYYQLIGKALDNCMPLKKIMYDIVLSYLSSTESFSLYDQYATDLMTINDSNADWYHWDMLRRAFAGVNAQYLAGLARDKAEGALLNHYRKKGELALRRFSALVSRSKYNSACELLNEIDNEYFSSILKTKYDDLIDYYDTFIKKKKMRDKFSEYIDGRQSYIVGVAPRDDKENLIEKNAIYIHMNYQGNNSDYEVDYPVNISYYNVHAANNYLTHDADFLCDLDYLVFKSIENVDCVKNSNLNTRESFRLAFGCPFGYPLMIPIIIFDLLHYNTEICLLHSNFYFSNNPYKDGYHTEKKYDDIRNILIGMSTHDLLGNWTLVKSWYDNRLFQCDDELKYVLSLSQDDYAKGLERIFFHQLKMN